MSFFKKKEEELVFTCKVGKMGANGRIIWIPKKYQGMYDRGAYVEVRIRKLK